MSRTVTLRARIATACAALRPSHREDRRVDAMLTAIRATAPAPATRPLAAIVVPTRPLQRVLVPRRTDTAHMPRIVLTASAQL